jgi:hypothetical protein
MESIDKAIIEAESLNSSAINEMLDGVPSNSPLMCWVRKCLRWAKFKSVPQPLLVFLKGFWGGMINSKFMEDTLRHYRAKEMENAYHKQAARVDIWQAASHLGVFNSYERREVSDLGSSEVPASFDWDGLFKRCVKDKLEGDELREFEMLAKVLGKQTWPHPSPASAQQFAPNLACVVSLAKMQPRNWNLANDAWKATLCCLLKIDVARTKPSVVY